MFMANLDEMHSRLALLMPSMVFPSFDVVTRDAVAFEVHCHSHRAGLTPMVLRLPQGLAKRYRADPSGNIPGTGLGLSLVEEIIELQGGRVEIRSEYERGTRVTLSLPLAPPLDSPGPSARQA